MLGALVVGAVGWVGLVAAPTPTPTADDVAAAVAEDGWYADPDSVGDREQLAMVAERLAHQGDPMGFTLLAAEPPGSSTAFAEDVLDVLLDRGDSDITTVVVLSDADVGVVSDVWSDRTIDAALDETIDDRGPTRPTASKPWPTRWQPSRTTTAPTPTTTTTAAMTTAPTTGVRTKERSSSPSCFSAASLL